MVLYPQGQFEEVVVVVVTMTMMFGPATLRSRLGGYICG
jgi:hypothetical protein